GNGNENHFLRPAWNLAQHQYVTHYIPRPLYDGGGVALRHDEVRRRRKRHPSMEVIVNGFNIFRCFERLQNWNGRHTEDFPFRAAIYSLRSDRHSRELPVVDRTVCKSL